jgi:hypothetical protein
MLFVRGSTCWRCCGKVRIPGGDYCIQSSTYRCGIHYTVAPGSRATIFVANYRKDAYTHGADIEPLRMAVVSLFRPEQSGRLFVPHHSAGNATLVG